jgi:hypothetical protein
MEPFDDRIADPSWPPAPAGAKTDEESALRGRLLDCAAPAAITHAAGATRTLARCPRNLR